LRTAADAGKQGVVSIRPDTEASKTPPPEAGRPPAPGGGGTTATIRRRAVGGANLVVGVVMRGQRDGITGLASQFAYNAFIATVPLLLVVISAIGLIGGPDAPDRIIATYREEIPEAYEPALIQILAAGAADQNRAALFLIVGAAGALYLVGNAIGALIWGLDRARGVPHRPWLQGKVVSIKYAAVWSVLMTGVNVLLLIGQDLINEAAARWDLSSDTRRTMLDVFFPSAALLLLVMVWVLYRFGPNAPRRRLLAYMGGIVVAVVGIIGFTQLFALYIANFDTFAVYGGLIGVVVYLTFLWGVGLALLVGAEVNEELLAWRRGKPTVVRRLSRFVDQDRER
jgi:membrane protein